MKNSGTTTEGQGDLPTMKGDFIDNLPKIYGIYTGGFIVFIFAMALLEEEKIACMPGESFGEAAAGHLRVALTIDDDQMVDALRRLRAFAEGKL